MGPRPTHSNVNNFGVYWDSSELFERGMHMDNP
jgi:hypothetical protein